MTSSNGNIFRVTGALCGEFTGPGEFPTQRPVTQGFDVFSDLCHRGHYDVNVMDLRLVPHIRTTSRSLIMLRCYNSNQSPLLFKRYFKQKYVCDDHRRSIYEIIAIFYSMEFAALKLADRIRQELDTKEFASSILLDLYKAFHIPDHILLLSKLHCYGRTGTASNLITRLITFIQREKGWD